MPTSEAANHHNSEMLAHVGAQYDQQTSQPVDRSIEAMIRDLEIVLTGNHSVHKSMSGHRILGISASQRVSGKDIRTATSASKKTNNLDGRSEARKPEIYGASTNSAAWHMSCELACKTHASSAGVSSVGKTGENSTKTLQGSNRGSTM